jgi:endonuclease/exonuclease/phosphatase family metal-dependent hydrolase
MKLISLNTWGCRIEGPIFEYIKEHSGDTDIFCFQEILRDGKGKTAREEIKSAYEDITQMLPNYVGYFCEYTDHRYYDQSFENLDFKYGIACFVRKNLDQSFIDKIDLYDPVKKWSDYSGRFAAGTALAIKVENYMMVNVHGLWQGSIKEDTEAKIEQSERIIKLAEKTSGRKVICGDFNLLPQTKSIKMLSDKYNNLIQKFNILNTRSSLYTKAIRYSDYIFTDKNVIVNLFEVPNMDISDHLPLLLEIN